MFRLLVISHPEMLPGEAEIIQQLFNEGLECFHLRKPQVSEEKIRLLLNAIPAAYHKRIALHSLHHLAEEYGIRRLHFTEQHRQSRAGASLEAGSPLTVLLTALKEKGYILSTSVHSIEALQSLPSCFSYAFFGPVFNSISKQGYKSVVNKDFCWKDDQKKVPVIALGGIDTGNIQEVKAMNFDGAAVLGALWNEPEKAVNTYKLFQARVVQWWVVCQQADGSPSFEGSVNL
jgi:thiamine-phosphate pyrophosphorylase